MECTNCGYDNHEGVVFCAQCGKALKEDPIQLDLQQIAVPAAQRKTHIKKVNAKAAEKPAQVSETVQENTPEAEQPAQTQEPSPADTPAQDDLIPLTQANEGQATAIDKTAEPMRIKNWIPVFLLSAIPVVNIIMLFVWSFSPKTNQSKQSFARLSLIFWAIGIVLCVAVCLLAVFVFQVDYSAVITSLK